MIGKTISQYKILEKLGEGGMGVVYKALDTKLERFVALKFLPQDVSLSAEDKARFLQEARAASAVSHANVCVIYDIAEHEGQQFIVMEYVDGKTLRQMVPIEKVQDALGYAIQIGEALEAAHSKGVVHRDIKAENIMVGEGNVVKVMDFGLAKLRGSLKLTKTSSTVGTLAYMAPEQIQGGEVDARSDIFSFGVVLYEMLTGRLPFVGEHEAAVMYCILNKEPEPIKRYKPELSSEVLHVINRALEKDPADRYQTARDMVIDLRRAKKETSRVSRGPLAGIPAFSGDAKAHEEIPKAHGEVLKTRERRLERPATEMLPGTEMRPSPKVRKVSNRNLVLGVLGVVIVGIVVISIFIVRKQPAKRALVTHRQVTFTGKVSIPSISPDGNFIAYVSQDSPGESKILVQDLTGGQPIEVYKAKELLGLRWSPDGSEISFFARTDSVFGSYIIPRLGGTPRKVPKFNFASWSPDGSRLALSTALPEKRIWFVDRVSGDTTSSLPLKGNFAWLFDVDWSPAGDLLLFNTVAQERYTIWTIASDGSRQSKVIEDSVQVSSPLFSQKGDAIYYLRLQGQTRDLMKVKIDRTSGKAEGSPAIIQAGLQVGDVFSITKDNRRLLYTREQHYSNLWFSRSEQGTLETRQLTKGSSQVISPSISPDGEKIAFSMGNPSQANIFVMPIEGGRMEQLTFFDSFNDGPVWSPDGKEIAFGSMEGGTPRVWRVRSSGGTSRPFRKTVLSRDAFNLAWAPCSKILYQRPENRNFNFLNRDTEEESPLVRDDSVGWMFYPRYSPDCKKVVVRWNRMPAPGIWVISLADTSQILLEPGRIYPIGWSADGNWIYAVRELGPDALSPKILMLSSRGDREKRLLTLPFEEIATTGLYFSVTPDGKRLVCAVSEAQSDAWLMENFDTAVK